MINFELKGEYIELFKLLKFENLAESGGHAKQIIAEGLIRVNGETETRKGKKCRPGDVIEFAGEKILIMKP